MCPDCFAAAGRLQAGESVLAAFFAYGLFLLTNKNYRRNIRNENWERFQFDEEKNRRHSRPQGIAASSK
jgi:hypothetical protein